MRNFVITPLLHFLTAFRFLTIVPFSWRADEDHTHFTKCMGYFPLVGLSIGVLGFFGAQLMGLLFPPSIVVVISLMFLVGISGGLHLDGLADSADGLLSARPRKDMLRIMKDSRSGVMGIIAVVFCLLLKFAALTSLSADLACLAVFLMPITGRCAILYSMARLPYARTEGGLGLLFYSRETKRKAFISLFTALILALFFLNVNLMMQILLFTTISVTLFNRWCTSKLGGATGDTLGAVCEIAEATTAVVLTIHFDL